MAAPIYPTRVTLCSPGPDGLPVDTTTPMATTGVAFDVTKSWTRPENTTLYGAGDVIGIADAVPANAGSAIHELPLIGPAGGHIVIDRVELEVFLAAVPAGMGNFRLHFYDVSPTAILDNAVFNLVAGDRGKHLGFVDIITPEDLGDTLKAIVTPMLALKLAAAATSLYFQLETRGSFTPASATGYKVRVHAQRAA